MGLTAAIMQPTYLPWLGYFALMDRVDVFVFLDDVQFEKQSWQCRNRIKTATGPLWLSVPVLRKGRFGQRICDVEIRDDAAFPGNHLRTIGQSYSRAPHAAEMLPPLEGVLRQGWKLLCDLNLALIEWMRGVLGITTRCLRSSEIECGGGKVERLVGICRSLGADRYISPPGSREYLEGSDAFPAAGIALEYHDYAHPEYPQLHGAFEPHLSALDLMLNAGPRSLPIIRSGLAK